MSTHYVAQLKIERVDKPDSQGRMVPPEPKREVAEVTQLTIKAETLPSLIEKLGKHIVIIEE